MVADSVAVVDLSHISRSSLICSLIGQGTEAKSAQRECVSKVGMRLRPLVNHEIGLGLSPPLLA